MFFLFNVLGAIVILCYMLSPYNTTEEYTVEMEEYTAGVLKNAYKDRIEYLPPDEDKREFTEWYNDARNYVVWRDQKIIRRG